MAFDLAGARARVSMHRDHAAALEAEAAALLSEAPGREQFDVARDLLNRAKTWRDVADETERLCDSVEQGRGVLS